MNPLDLPRLTKHVTDFSGVLSSEQTELLAAKFAEQENASTEQVLIVLIPHRQGHELRDIGLKLFNENGIGQRDLNNGLLLIISTEEKKLRIITGKGMEIKYSEMVCREIVERHLRPLLDAGKYEEMIIRWREIVRGDLAISITPSPQNPSEDLITKKISDLMRTKNIIPISIATISCFALTQIIAIFSLPISMFLGGIEFFFFMTLLILIVILSILGLLIFLSTRRTFEQKKSRIMNLYSSVLSDMNIDFRDGRAHAVNIHDISQSIENLADEIEHIAGDIQREPPENQKWLMDIILEFNTQLRIWIDRHTDELETIENEIRNRESVKNSEKAILELTYTRLESHRHILEKI